jgi:hypothetical protein
VAFASASQAAWEPNAKAVVGLTGIELNDDRTWAGGKGLHAESPVSLVSLWETTDRKVVIIRFPESVDARGIEIRS